MEKANLARMISEDPDILPFAVAVVKNALGQVLMHQSPDGYKFPGVQMTAGEDPMRAAARGCAELTGVNPNPVRPMPLNFADSSYFEFEGEGECSEGCEWVDPKMAYQSPRFPLYHQAKRVIRNCLM